MLDGIHGGDGHFFRARVLVAGSIDHGRDADSAVAQDGRSAFSKPDTLSDIADYSMISSAAAENAIGTSMPSALAVLRLRTNSYLAACITGSSPGFSPLRMRVT